MHPARDQPFSLRNTFCSGVSELTEWFSNAGCGEHGPAVGTEHEALGSQPA